MRFMGYCSFVRYIHSCDTVTEIVCGGKSWQSYNKTAETLGRRPDGEASGSPTKKKGDRQPMARHRAIG